MVHIMDWSALKFMPTILPFHEVAVNDQPEIERFKQSTRMSQTGRTAPHAIGIRALATAWGARQSATRKVPSDLPKAAVHIAYRLLRRIRSVEAIIQHSDSLERVRVILEWQSS